MTIKSIEALNVLIALPNKQIADGIANTLRQAGVKRIQYAENSKDALSCMASTGRINMFFMGSDLQPHGGIDFARFIRLTNSAMAKADIILHLAGDVTKDEVLSARNAGISALMVGDLTGADVLKQMRQVIQNRRLFITSDSYTGPDRRRPNPPPYAGPERRQA